jgi:type II secretory pathway pseudopilin PulG
MSRRGKAAFSLTEAVVALAVGGVMIVSLYSGMTSATFSMRMAREDVRATQIMLDKIEVVRLCSWDQINDKDFMPTTFTVPIYPELGNNSPMITGTLSIEKVPTLPATYKHAVALVTVTVKWGEKGKLQRSRQMSTYVSQHGITKYLLQKA